jgi:FixJ family two-component response regulator
MTRPTVFIVDDDESFLRASTRQLRAAGYNVRAFDSARGLLTQLSPDSTGCVVADLQMPELSGLDLQEALLKAENPLPVIFLTGHGDVQNSVKAMRRGAEDFLTKRAPSKELCAAINRALERDAKERARRNRARELRQRFGLLTRRETEVLTHVVEGKMNKEIASALGINERTVKLHRTSFSRKLDVRSVAELARLFEEAKRLQSDS